jgi:Condensation domain
MVTMSSKLTVEFAGEGSGVQTLSWGQQAVWRGIEVRGAPIILRGIYPAPAGKTAEEMAADLGRLVGRHQSLRTVFRPGGDDQLEQVVMSSGETVLEVVEAGDADPRDIAEKLADGYEFGDRDYAHELPLRAGVVCQHGAPVYEVFGMCHMSVDGFGTNVIEAELGLRGPEAAAQALGPVTEMPPLEQAAWQNTQPGLRQNAAAERYWDRVLRLMPAHWFPVPAETPSQRYGEMQLSSSAAYLASRVVAARLETDTRPVVLAAFAVALARVSGVNPAVPRLFVNNRFRPGFADTVSAIAQTCLCAVDVAGVTFDEAVRRSIRAVVPAYKYAYFKPVKIREVLARVGDELGSTPDVGFLLNDRRETQPVTGPLASPGEISAARAKSTLRQVHKEGGALDQCHIAIVESAGSLELTGYFDTGYMAPDSMAAVLRAFEEVLVAAGIDPAARTGV